MWIAVGNSVNGETGEGTGTGGGGRLSAPSFEWSLAPLDRIPKTIGINVGASSTFPFTIYWGEGTETVVTSAGNYEIRVSAPLGIFEIRFSAGASVAVEGISGINDVLSLSNIIVGTSTFESYTGQFSSTNLPKEISTTLTNTFRTARAPGQTYLPSNLSSWDVSNVTTFQETFFNNPAVTDSHVGPWTFGDGAVIGDDTFSLMSDAEVASCLVQWNSNPNQGSNVELLSSFSNSSGGPSPRTLSQSTYPAAKTAYDNLLSTYSWTDTDAINWVA